MYTFLIRTTSVTGRRRRFRPHKVYTIAVSVCLSADGQTDMARSADGQMDSRTWLDQDGQTDMARSTRLESSSRINIFYAADQE